jgi:hypothetical protein
LIDDEIEEARLEIRHLETGALVTVIEGSARPTRFGARGDGPVSWQSGRRPCPPTYTGWRSISCAGARRH